MQELVEKLIEDKKTISTMESCTGGGVANAITNVEGASAVLQYSAVTYSNEYKIKMGVSSAIIDEFSVYSMETAHEMSENISEFAASDYGVGITGKLNRVDINNPYGKDNVVFISIYDRENKEHFDLNVKATLGSRKENKDLVINEVKKAMLNILSSKKEQAPQKIKNK